MTHFRNITIPIVTILILMLAGCHHDSTTLQELVSIDSMLTVAHQYENALHRLDSIQLDGFNKEERAYYSLLLAQARFKNYIDDTTDTVINVAVNYYKNSNDNEKRTRAYLYQGCVYEGMKKQEKAVESYKMAEKTADENDLENRAYVNLRLGVLYQKTIVGAKTTAIEKYDEALKLYRQLNDKHYELLCLTNIGAIYRDFKDKERQDSALYYIDSAIDLAQKQNEVFFVFSNLYHKAEFYELFKQDYLNAKNYAVRAIRIGGKEIDHPRAHYCAAKSYIKLGQIDSALYYLNRSPKSVTANDSIMYYNLLANISRFRNDHVSWLSNQNKAITMGDSILIGNLNAQLLSIEKKYDVQQEKMNSLSMQSKLIKSLLAVTLLALLALALAFLVWRYRNRFKMKQNEAEMLKADLDDSLASLQQMQARLNDYEHSQQSDQLRAIINQQIDTVHQLMEWSYVFDDNKFASKFREMMSLPHDSDDSSYWLNLQAMVNDLHDNILVKAQETAGGKLTDSELNLLALYCCGFSRTVIMLAMGYKNIGSVYNKKLQIAKKLGVNNLDDFLRTYH